MDRKEYQRQYIRQHYKNNKQYYIDKSARRRKMLAAQMQEYKLGKGCSYCGYNKCARALTFHHIEGDKKFNISSATRAGYGKKKLEEEMNKCIILCFNCHMEQHDII